MTSGHDQNLEQLLAAVGDSMSGNYMVLQSAEQRLSAMQQQPGYGPYLMQAVGRHQLHGDLRHQCAILLRGFIRQHWSPNMSDSIIPPDHKELIRNTIVSLLLSLKYGPIQNAVIAAVTQIAFYDFPKNWPNLLNTLASNFGSQSLVQIHAALSTMRSVVERYEGKSIASDRDLADEINLAIESTFEPFRLLFEKLVQQLMSSQLPPHPPNHPPDQPIPAPYMERQMVLRCLRLVIQIYYSLTYCDVHLFFQQSALFFAQGFHVLLTSPQISALLPPPETRQSLGRRRQGTDVVIEMREVICQIIDIFQQKYDEEFAPSSENFVLGVMDLLMGLQQQNRLFEEQFSTLVAFCIKFLTTVARSGAVMYFQKHQEKLHQLLDFVIRPSMRIQLSDLQNFETDPQKYIRRDIQSASASYTRRRTSLDLVKALADRNRKMMTEGLMRGVMELLKQYDDSNGQNWQAKDTAHYLFLAAATVSKTRQNGVIEVARGVDVGAWFEQYVFPDLHPPMQGQPGPHPILVADALRFLCQFRSILITPDKLAVVMPSLIHFLKSGNRVIRTYSAWCVERFLYIYDDPPGRLRFTRDQVPMGGALLEELSKALLVPSPVGGGPPSVEENEYVMKSIMRVAVLLQDAMAPVLPPFVQNLCSALGDVMKNPANGLFNHYLFESLAAGIKFNGQFVPQFEELLFPVFEQIFQKQVEEFTPYVFQLLKILLFHRPAVDGFYNIVFRNIVDKTLDDHRRWWENTGNIPALVQLLGEYARKAPGMIQEHFVPVMTIFNRLVNQSRLDHMAFDLLNQLVFNLPNEVIQPHLPKVFTILFNRLQRMRTKKFVRCLVIFLSVLVLRFDSGVVVGAIGSVRQGLFGRVMNLWLENVHFVQGSSERKLCSVGLGKMLCEMAGNPNFDNPDLWVHVLFNIVKFLEFKQSNVTFLTEREMDELQELQAVNQAEFRGRFVQLVYAKLPQVNYTKDIDDSKVFFARKLAELVLTPPQTRARFLPLIQGSAPDVLTALEQYFRRAQINPQILQ